MSYVSDNGYKIYVVGLMREWSYYLLSANFFLFPANQITRRTMKTPTTENAQQAEKGGVPLSQSRTGVREGFRCIADAEVLIRALVKAKEDKDTTRLIDVLQGLNEIKMTESLLNSTEVKELRKQVKKLKLRKYECE